MKTPCIVILEDYHAEKSGFFRAFTADAPDAETVCTLVGYCSPGGSFRTISAAAADARRREPSLPIFRGWRNGNPSRLISLPASLS